MYKLMMFMKRRPGLSVEAFRAYYEDRHVPLCMQYMAGPVRYVRRYVELMDGQEELDFDVVTEVWFNDRQTLDIVRKTLMRDAMPDDVIADERNVFDRDRARFCWVEEHETDLSQPAQD